MRKFLSTLVMVLAFSSVAHAAVGMPTPSTVRDRLNYGGLSNSRSVRLGTQVVDKKVQVMRAVYDFAVQGGSSAAAVNLTDEDGKDASIPSGAIIKQVLVHVITGVTSTGSATVSLGASTATDLLGATAKASLGSNVLVAGTPIGTAGTMIRLTAAKTLTATIGTIDLTAGKIEAFVEYYIGN